MKRLNWKKVTIGIGATLLILGGIGYWGMSFAVNKVLETIASDSIIASMEPSTTPGQVQGEPTPTTEPTGEPPTENSTDSSTPEGGTVAGSPSPAPTATVQPEAGTDGGYKAEIDASKAKDVQDSISMSDKMKVMGVFLKRFSTRELEAFSKLASGGLTVEEKKEAKKIVLERLTEEEYDELIQIAAKLGLSQGKSYGDSLNEK